MSCLAWVVRVAASHSSAVCCSVLQGVAVCCSVLQCVAASNSFPWGMSYIRISHVASEWVIESWHIEATHGAASDLWISHVTYQDESCGISLSHVRSDWVMPHRGSIWCSIRSMVPTTAGGWRGSATAMACMSYVTHTNKSFHIWIFDTYDMHAIASCYLWHEWVMSHIKMSCHMWHDLFTRDICGRCGSVTAMACMKCCSVLQYVKVCCSVLQCVAVCCSMLQCVAVCCGVLRCVAVCCSVLRWVAVSCS